MEGFAGLDKADKADRPDKAAKPDKAARPKSAQTLRNVSSVLHDSALLAVQNLLTHTHGVGSDLDKLIIFDEADGLLERHLGNRSQ